MTKLRSITLNTILFATRYTHNSIGIQTCARAHIHTLSLSVYVLFCVSIICSSTTSVNYIFCWYFLIVFLFPFLTTISNGWKMVLFQLSLKKLHHRKLTCVQMSPFLCSFCQAFDHNNIKYSAKQKKNCSDFKKYIRYYAIHF